MCEQSNSVESVLLKMQTSLACTICLDLLNNPLTTKCGHTFCKFCLDKLHLGPKNSFPCPLCITPVTRRSVSQNAKITELVLAVRNVISSIKKDCGFQEPKKNVTSKFLIEPEKEEPEEDVPIRRTTRKNKPISFYADEVFLADVKKRSTKKIKVSEETTNSERVVARETNGTNIPINESLKAIKAGTSCGSVILPTHSNPSKPQISKVEQWLSKNESINFGKESKLCPEENLLTQVFKEVDDKDKRYDSVCNVENKLSKTVGDIDNAWTSQSSTIIFRIDTEKNLERASDTKSTLVNNCNKKLSDEEALAKEETNSMVSEKENELKDAASLQPDERRRGNKRILFEPNKIDVKKVNKRNAKHTLINEGEDVENKGRGKIPKQFMDLAATNTHNEELVKGVVDDTNVYNDTEIPKSEGEPKIDEPKHNPNSKGHNIRFASAIKLKSLETKPPLLLINAKSKKSPGWSRLEGAKRDLRSKHTSLNICGGEQKMNLDLSKDLSKMPIESSQESVVIIEEANSQAIADSIPYAKGTKKLSNSSFSKIQNKSSNLQPQIKQSSKIKSGRNHFSKDIIQDQVELNHNSIDKISSELNCSSKLEISNIANKSIVDNEDKHFNKTDEKLNNVESNVDSDENLVDKQISFFETKAKKNFNNIIDQRPTLNRSRLSRKNLKTNTFIDKSDSSLNKESIEKTNEPLLTNETTEKVEEPKNLNVDTDMSGNLREITNDTHSKNESKQSAEEKGGEIVEKISDKAQELINNDKIESLSVPKTVPFVREGTFEDNRNENSICKHSIPCDLFHMLVKYSKFFVNESQQRPCPYYNKNKDLSEKGGSIASYKVLENQETTTTSSVVSDSCTGIYEQEVAIILPDSVPGTSLKFNENLADQLKELSKDSTDSDNKGEDELINNEDELINNEDELVRNEDELDNDENEHIDNDGDDSCEGSISSQMSTSVLRDNILCADEKAVINSEAKAISIEDPKPKLNEINKTISPARVTWTSPRRAAKSCFDSQGTKIQETGGKILSSETPNLISDQVEQNSYKTSASKRNIPKSYFNSQDLKISEPSSVISPLSSEKLSKKSSESPIAFKRNRRTQRIDSSSSSSEDELPDFERPQKKTRIQSQGFSSLPRSQGSSSLPQSSPKVDSEELRDFERYDENVWNYYKKKEEESNPVVLTPKKECNMSRGKKRLSVVLSRIDDSSDDEVIPGTEEELKHNKSDLSNIKEKKEDKNVNEESFVTCESVPGTVDLFSQDSIATKTSTLCGMNTSVKELFNKCNMSLNIAHTILNESQILSQDFEKPNTNISENLRPNPDLEDTRVIREEEETVDESHFSVFSADSPVLSTQQRNKVQSEVDSLRNKILALEAEMNEKKATLTESKMNSSKAGESVKEIPSVAPIINPEEEKVEESERESDLESEELFKSATADPLFRKGVTLRNGRSLGNTSKVFGRNKPIAIICTGLNHYEVSKVHSFASSFCGMDAKVMTKWSEDITHVIVKTDQEGLTERTLKYLLGVATGAWVVSISWVLDSLTSKILLPEDEYEALDCTGAPGPSRGRRVSVPIFAEFQFVLVPPFEDVSIDQLQDLIRVCRGSIVKRFDDSKSGSKFYIVNSEDPEKEKSNRSICIKRDKITVGHDWIIECIGMYSLVSLLNYMVGTPTQSQISASCIPPSLIHETQEIV